MKQDVFNSVAIVTTYGSISAVTFVTAAHVAAMALMRDETPSCATIDPGSTQNTDAL